MTSAATHCRKARVGAIFSTAISVTLTGMALARAVLYLRSKKRPTDWFFVNKAVAVLLLERYDASARITEMSSLCSRASWCVRLFYIFSFLYASHSALQMHSLRTVCVYILPALNYVMCVLHAYSACAFASHLYVVYSNKHAFVVARWRRYSPYANLKISTFNTRGSALHVVQILFRIKHTRQYAKHSMNGLMHCHIGMHCRRREISLHAVWRQFVCPFTIVTTLIMM